MVADRLGDDPLGPASVAGAEPRARSPSLAGRVAATVRGLASGGGLRPPGTSRGDGDGRGDDAGELHEFAPYGSARAADVGAPPPAVAPAVPGGTSGEPVPSTADMLAMLSAMRADMAEARHRAAAAEARAAEQAEVARVTLLSQQEALVALQARVAANAVPLAELASASAPGSTSGSVSGDDREADDDTASVSASVACVGGPS